MLTNPVVVAVVVMVGLSLLKLNVLLALILGAVTGGLVSGMTLVDTLEILIGGMGGNAETALNYILLGALAAAIHQTGAAKIVTQKLSKNLKGTGRTLIFIIAFVSIFSQNLIPVHIAFIPILIPPLISVFNKLKIDRRAVATALTFGLKSGYIFIPVGYGLIFHNIIRDEMGLNGMDVSDIPIWQILWIPSLAMLVGLVIAVLITYRKPREYDENTGTKFGYKSQDETEVTLSRKHIIALIGAVSALIVQLIMGSLVFGAIVGLAIMVAGGAIKWSNLDAMVKDGVGMMGFIAFVMLVASGFGDVIRETGGVDALVDSLSGIIGENQFFAATGMIILGLFITMGIGTSFGTVPIIATIYVPLAFELGFSPAATILLIGSAAALGDAGSPASDSTLGPTAGLNIDGQHDHIWDTCVATFTHFDIPIMIFGIIGAVIL
ncbi:Histidine permease YuiF [Alkalibacterium sp. AK22]|uniref:Na+/H+ antiporter family protein n=1 Tax=Alkalibacterium sp. AK22 TaxID=1229520 RepID=UPI000450435F|nr:Na+/H+ antiporter NhaC family protein [Alkalibacterium sp. AK22]EXJ22615.1 Histidine permease YuiF [Alkalibacterium sp. AK22]